MARRALAAGALVLAVAAAAAAQQEELERFTTRVANVGADLYANPKTLAQVQQALKTAFDDAPERGRRLADDLGDAARKQGLQADSALEPAVYTTWSVQSPAFQQIVQEILSQTPTGQMTTAAPDTSQQQEELERFTTRVANVGADLYANPKTLAQVQQALKTAFDDAPERGRRLADDLGDAARKQGLQADSALEPAVYTTWSVQSPAFQQIVQEILSQTPTGQMTTAAPDTSQQQEELERFTTRVANVGADLYANPKTLAQVQQALKTAFDDAPERGRRLADDLGDAARKQGLQADSALEPAVYTTWSVQSPAFQQIVQEILSQTPTGQMTTAAPGTPTPAPGPGDSSTDKTVTPPEKVQKTGHVVKGEITLVDFTKDAFDAVKFSTGMAAAFQVEATLIQVLGVTEESRRICRTCAESVTRLKVDFQLSASSAEDAKGIEESVKTKAPEEIATALKGAGLPATFIAVANLAATDLDATTPTPTPPPLAASGGSPSFWDKQDPNALIGVGGAVLGAGCLAFGAVAFFAWRGLQTAKSRDMHAPSSAGDVGMTANPLMSPVGGARPSSASGAHFMIRRESAV